MNFVEHIGGFFFWGGGSYCCLLIETFLIKKKLFFCKWQNVLIYVINIMNPTLSYLKIKIKNPEILSEPRNIVNYFYAEGYAKHCDSQDKLGRRNINNLRKR